MKTKSGACPLMKETDNKESLRFDNKSKAGILQRQFLSVFTNESHENVQELPTSTWCIKKAKHSKI